MLRSVRQHWIQMVGLAVLLSGTAAVLVMHARPPAPRAQYDVAVVGAGPGGVAASIQAARMGARVALFEPTDWIGGQTTAAGVGNMDEGNIAARESGLYKEFVAHVQSYYAARHKSVDTCYYDTNSLCVDPLVGQIILRQMLDSVGPNLQVFTRSPVSAVTKQGDAVTGVVVNGDRIGTKVLIDDDEYGDILAQAGAAYRLGTGTSSKPNTESCVQSITFAATIRYYPDGVPASLQFHAPPPGYTSRIAQFFAAYVKQNGSDHFVSNTERNLSFQSYAAFRGFPDLANPLNYGVLQQHGRAITRTSLNLGNDFPRTGNLSTSYISDPGYRARTTCDAKLLTLQMVYYIQHDMHETNWSIANDEGYDTAFNRSQHCVNLTGYEAFENQMPQEPYVREGRRLVGEATLTGDELVNAWKDPAQTPRFADSIAVGYYPMDLHSCHEPLETAFDSPGDLRQAFSGGAFEVPLGALIPAKVDGLLAAEKNISASREANGAIREQPIAMATGQAAGALAVLAVEQNEQPRAVPYQEVQHVLHAAGVVTSVK